MTFHDFEIAYLRTQDLGRLATVQPDGTLQVSPVGFTFNAELGTIDVGGYRMTASRKYRNVAANGRVAFVVDDLASRDPWRVRCLEVRGMAEAVGDLTAVVHGGTGRDDHQTGSGDPRRRPPLDDGLDHPTARTSSIIAVRTASGVSTRRGNGMRTVVESSARTANP